ncbi:MAG: hypothetical protein PUP46_00210 [Endozoicomonas sp. (ex Botrylloides leachii)]|nr:hypothetical protein [Endozoicomonas sp. (ex Botrylloides leachii)]
MTHSNQSMPPSDSPGQPENANRGVRRINNRALFIGIGLVVFFAVVIGLGAYDRSRANQNPSLYPLHLKMHIFSKLTP